jgi:hypothetical protein
VYNGANCAHFTSSIGCAWFRWPVLLIDGVAHLDPRYARLAETALGMATKHAMRAKGLAKMSGKAASS